MKLTNDENSNPSAHCRCKESPYDCTISSYVPRNLAPSGGISLPIPGKGDVVINRIYITNWVVNNVSCSISVIDSASTTCGSNDYYPSFDELRVSGSLNLTFYARLVVDQSAVGGGANDNYWIRGDIVANPFQMGVAIFLRHLESFLAPSLSACTGRDLQDVGLSLIRFYIGNPARITLRWTSVPTTDILRKFIAFLDAQFRYLALNQSISATVRNPYLGPASVFDLSDFIGTDVVNWPSTTRSCRSGGKIGHPLGGNVWFDIGIETAWCALSGGILKRGAINVVVDYDDIPSVGDPGTLSACPSCPSVTGGANPCSGSHICGAVHCSFFQRFWCLLVREQVLNIEDPPGSGIPISRNTSGTFGSIMSNFGNCEQWIMFLPKIKSYCPDGSNKDMGIRVVPTGCGNVWCGTVMQRPSGGTLVNYPVDLRFYVPLDIEFWINDGGWRRLFSLLTDLNLGLNLAWWFCATGGGSPCQAWHRVFYLGAVIDPQITAVQQDPTLPGYPPGGWAQSIADIIGVLLNGNLFFGAYVGIGLKPIIDPDDVLANPPALDPVPSATYTPGSFAEPNLSSSIDVFNNFLRIRWNISGQLTASWLGRLLDNQLDIAPPLVVKPRKVGRTYVTYSKPSWDKLEVLAYTDGLKNSHFVWRVDGGIWRGPEPEGRFILGPFLEGKHVVEIAAIDINTGEFTEPARIEFNIDSVPPSIKTNIQDVMPTEFVLVISTYDFQSKDEEILLSWQINGGEWSEWSPRRTFEFSVPEGENIIKIKAKDKNGNISIYSKKFFAVENPSFGCGGRGL